MTIIRINVIFFLIFKKIQYFLYLIKLKQIFIFKIVKYNN